MSARSGSEPVRSADAALPTWLVRHPLIAGWVWIALFSAVLVAAEVFDWPVAGWLIAITLAVLPSLAAMITVLEATPRRSLENHGSVFGHFFSRYLVVIAGFLAWTASIVIGSTISASLNLLAADREEEVLGLGFQLMIGIVLPAITVLWIVFMLRCAWFLIRVRGWAEHPASTTVPARLFLRRPRLRTVTIGLAHPGLLVAAAIVSGLALLAIEVSDLTVQLT
ncbi:hypothetical protein [Microterricola gilva]|uniref:hypothetical protein n=1 Tax=Microterricola gilva TaxID=393267 RepID=UPI00102AEB6E|nr:hypothetical protein [Microterricola gilva]